MRSFSQLLQQYVERAGISDAELARRLGVSRQTVFRWREGETQRPRHREDVLRLAATLRLATEERDALLTAAGFRPQGPPPGPDHEDPHMEPGASFSLRRRLPALILVAIAVLLIGFLAWTPSGSQLLRRLPWNRPQPAAPGELLVAVSPFANYGGASGGYNVAGRVQEALEAAFRQAEVPARVEILSTEIRDETEAQVEADRLRAALVIWGEYDSGRIIAYTTSPRDDSILWAEPRRWHVASSEALSTTINSNVPAELRWIALTVLGRVHMNEDQPERAQAAFQQALAEPPSDDHSQAVIYYYLGLIESGRPEPSLDELVAYYTEAIERRPQMVSALNNRGLAYLERDEPGDLARAERDFRLAADLAPDLAAPAINMAAVYQLRGDPDEIEILLNWLERAVELKPADPRIHNNLCWYYSLSGRPQEALPYCDQALASGDLTNSHDSRALALALLGRTEEAIDEFQIFLTRLQTEDPTMYREFRSTRERWIEMLKAGEDPFDEELLRGLYGD